MKRLAAIAAAVLLAASCRQSVPAQSPEGGQPQLFLLTSLPLLWSEGFGLEQSGSPALDALEQKYRVTPIDLPSQLPGGALLLAAQPRALPPEELVALDAWVRRGGRIVLLADPMLEWPSQLPLGDVRRPPASFPDTGLLQHWELRLDAPEQRGPKFRGGGHFPLIFNSPGTLVSKSPHCQLSRAGIIAECRIGKGQIAVVADADWLDERQVPKREGKFANHLSELLELLSSVRSSR